MGNRFRVIKLTEDSKLGGAIKIAAWVVTGLMIGSFLLALSASGKFAQNPHVPDLATGRTIPLSLRGTGTVYVNLAEWDSVSIYWSAVNVFTGAWFFLLVTVIVLWTYVRFIQKKPPPPEYNARE